MGKPSNIIQKGSSGHIVFIAEKELPELYHFFPSNGVKVEVFAPKDARNFLKVNQLDLILLDCGSETEKELGLLLELTRHIKN